MYIHSRDENNVKVPLRLTRAMNKIVFKTATKCSGKYLGSPFCKGTLLWNSLDSDIQKSNSEFLFTRHVKKLNNVYQEIW